MQAFKKFFILFTLVTILYFINHVQMIVKNLSPFLHYNHIYIKVNHAVDLC